MPRDDDQLQAPVVRAGRNVAAPSLQSTAPPMAVSRRRVLGGLGGVATAEWLATGCASSGHLRSVGARPGTLLWHARFPSAVLDVELTAGILCGAMGSTGICGFRTSTGMRAWTTAGHFTSLTPAGSGLVVTFQGSQIRAFSANTGMRRWTSHFPFITESLLPWLRAAEGVLYTTGRVLKDRKFASILVAMDGSTGHRKWSVTLPPKDFATG